MEVFFNNKSLEFRNRYEETLNAFETRRKKLGVEYVNLYLIHWSIKDKYLEAWKALEKLYKEGLTRLIGVCNFTNIT